MRFLFYIIIILTLFNSVSYARPISYAGGWTTMFMNDDNRNKMHVHFSPTHKISIGLNIEYFHDEELFFNSIQVNNLLKRWNKKKSQANFYLKSGFGIAYTDKNEFDGKSQASGFTGISFDWENRSYFIKYENRYFEAGKIYNSFTQSATFGIAPYEGNYGDLHTWLMIKVENKPEKEDSLTVTPLIRLFKNVYLFELGLNDRGKFLFNYVKRY